MTSANNVYTFKKRLDRSWANQELIFDYNSTLTETGNRCFVDSFDIDTFSCPHFNITHLMGIDASAVTLSDRFALHCFETCALYINSLSLSSGSVSITLHEKIQKNETKLPCYSGL